MVKLAFNSSLAQKDAKKEDENSEVLIIPESKVRQTEPPCPRHVRSSRDVIGAMSWPGILLICGAR